MKKRIFSFLLVLLLAVALLPFSALMEDAQAADDTITYTVLVLDAGGSISFTSGGTKIYTADSAINEVKQAASTFLLDVIKAKGTNYVAVVSYNTEAKTVSGFTDDLEGLRSKVNGISASGRRNIAAGLNAADALLKEIPSGSNIKKNVVLFTTGNTDTGSYSNSGHYSSSTIASNWQNSETGVKLYKYANTAYSAAANLKKQADRYVIGLFQTMEGMPAKGQDIATFFRIVARDLASAEEVFYECTNPNDLQNVFSDVADSVTDIVAFPFDDVKNSDWFYRAVKYVWKHNLMSGTASNRFDPEISTTRAMIVMVLYNFEGQPAVSGGNSFYDVAAGEWYDDAVTWAQQNNIVVGFSETQFGPTYNITREQMAAILYRYSAYKGYDVTKRASLAGFTDAWQISDYAVENLQWAKACGYINGTTTTTLSPLAYATRAQVAAIFQRFFQDVL